MLPEPWVPFGIGRFALDLPPNARLRGRQQALVQLPVTARPLAPGEDLAAIHQQMMADKRALPPPPGRPQVVHSARMLRGDMVSIIHFDDPDTPDSIVMEAVMVAGGTAFTIRGGNSLDRAAALEDAAARIGAALLPTTEPNPPVPGFAIDRAVIAMPMHWQESADAFFHVGDHVTLALESHSNADLLPRPLIEKQMLGLPRLAAVGVMAIATRSGPRMLADLPGEEVILKQPAGGALLQWEYVGEPRSSSHPHVSIRMELDDEVSLDATLPLWDMLLTSFRRRREA
ncbi:T6SS immunity protein Tli4 family protein [Chondromyces apiculatus]|uniref:Tle cognate immunity protein 4 C-terminal domain-containing protein n=1 Tax=Chondromyces apiculatus DSM 436 TaxID=1192034 RepID=A0A017TH09_9BACT|nr:T6SS immunity protein Tli4 family protein [Chondromyces apiculatus]EYF08095.1 Hypothetical protein CAP_5855 [Chondromyces apiculatus DSM 436]